MTGVRRTREGQCAQPCCNAPRTPAQGWPATTAPWTRTAWWARVWVGTRRGSTYHTSQHRATLGVPRVELALFMHLERSLSVLAHVLRQTASESFHAGTICGGRSFRLIIRDLPRPARVVSTSRPSRDPLTLPGHTSLPVVPPAHFRSHLVAVGWSAKFCVEAFRSRLSASAQLGNVLAQTLGARCAKVRRPPVAVG